MAFNISPQEKSAVSMALIIGAEVSTVKAEEVTVAATLPAKSVTSAVIV